MFRLTLVTFVRIKIQTLPFIFALTVRIIQIDDRISLFVFLGQVSCDSFHLLTLLSFEN